MRFSPVFRLAFPTFAAIGVALPAVAQSSPQSLQQPRNFSDSLAVEVDSTTPQHNWVVNVLRKVTFRGDDSSPAFESAASPATAAVPARKIRRTFDSKRDRLEYESARRTAEHATGWHYAEVASGYGLKLRHLHRVERVRTSNGTILTTQGDEVGVIQPGETEFIPLVLDEQIVFDNTLFVPPMGTKHRTMKGELGHYRLKLGDGYQLHGTPYTASIGSSVTHGCVSLHDEDIEWLFENVPVGTQVYLY